MINNLPEAPCETGDTITAFLMVGQSNMAGRGDLCDVEPINNERCQMFRMGVWQPMSEPINIDKSAHAEFAPGVGLAASFADELVRYTDSRIGLIPCAYGGSRIEKWEPGGDLFDHAVFITRLATRTSRLGGIIWHQGESNCRNYDREGYGEKFIRTMTELRRAVGAESLPLILGEIPENMGERWNMGDRPKCFNRYLHELASKLPVCAVASQEGLTLRPDGIHFSAVSCRELGRRYFEKYLELTK